jgi:hypothetical protein
MNLYLQFEVCLAAVMSATPPVCLRHTYKRHILCACSLLWALLEPTPQKLWFSSVFFGLQPVCMGIVKAISACSAFLLVWLQT